MVFEPPFVSLVLIMVWCFFFSKSNGKNAYLRTPIRLPILASSPRAFSILSTSGSFFLCVFGRHGPLFGFCPKLPLFLSIGGLSPPSSTKTTPAGKKPLKTRGFAVFGDLFRISMSTCSRSPADHPVTVHGIISGNSHISS